MVLRARKTKLYVLFVIFILPTIYLCTEISTRRIPIPSLNDWLINVSFPSPISSVAPKRASQRMHELDPWNSSAYLVGDAPTSHFRDRLRKDLSYITTWTDAGFTNMVMTYANLIYLGMLSDRIPIIPPFVPYHHVDTSAGNLLFSEVFDLPYLRSALGRPVLEWAEIKTKPSDESQVDSIGCWSAWAAGNVHERSPRYNTLHVTNALGLDVSYTAVPSHERRQPEEGGEYDWGLLFWHLAALIYPSSPLPRNLGRPFPSSKGTTLGPDWQLTCFDLLYFVTAGRDDSYEWTDSWNPSWREVGRHMKFNETLVNITQQYLQRVFRVREPGSIPRFIGIHIRHGDFVGLCAQKENCFAPLSAYATRVEEVQSELQQKLGIRIPDHHVLVTSDETDPEFWAAVKHQRWRYFDHEAEGTLTKYGEWFITLVDVVAQSLSTGFVGTAGSTVSTMGRRRVDDWNNGATRLVKWGRPGADDH